MYNMSIYVLWLLSLFPDSPKEKQNHQKTESPDLSESSEEKNKFTKFTRIAFFSIFIIVFNFPQPDTAFNAEIIMGIPVRITKHMKRKNIFEGKNHDYVINTIHYDQIKTTYFHVYMYIMCIFKSDLIMYVLNVTWVWVRSWWAPISTKIRGLFVPKGRLMDKR